VEEIMGINLRDKRLIPRVITRNRSRGAYRLAAKLTAKAITKDKALKLEEAINSYIRELRLVGVVKMEFKVGL
jgi:hypothetical protein